MPFTPEGEDSESNPAKNRRWGEEEHTKYVAFLEVNRDRLKNKLIRR